MQYKCLALCWVLWLFSVPGKGQEGRSLSLKKQDSIHLQDVEVIGLRGELSQSIHRLSTQEMQENKGKPLAESLTAISGVSTIGMGSSIVKPVINGLHSNRILILNNGVRQEGQQWGIEHAPEIDPFTADQLEIVKGAQGVRYGADALGGIVLVSANDIDLDREWKGNIDMVGQSNGRGGMINVFLEGAVKALPGLGWRMQTSGKKLGNYKTADYFLGNTGVDEFNYAGTLQYKNDKNQLELYFSHFGTQLGIFRGAHIGTVEDIQARIDHGRPFETYDFSYQIEAPRQKVTHDLVKVSWEHQLRAGRRLEMQYGLQRNHRREYDMRRVESDDIPMADMVLTTQSLDVVLKEGHSSIGIQSMVQVNNNTPGTGTTPIIPNFDSYAAGIFAVHQFHIDRWHVEIGGRYDFKYLDIAGYRYQRNEIDNNGAVEQYLLTDNRKFHNASGTAGTLYHFSPKFSWKSNIGLAWRAPSVNELYSDGVHHGSATYELGNPDLRSEKGLKWINAFIWSDERLQVTVDVYAQMLYDYIYAQPNPDAVRQTIRGTFPLFAYQQHDAFFYGADLQLRYAFLNTFHYDVSASVVRARNVELDSYLPYIPSARFHQALSWTYCGQSQPESYLKVGHRFIAKQNQYKEGMDYVAPPPAYHLFDVVASKQIKTNSDAQTSWNVMLSVENLFNQSYKDYMDRFRYFAHQMGRNVSVKISYQF